MVVEVVLFTHSGSAEVIVKELRPTEVVEEFNK